MILKIYLISILIKYILTKIIRIIVKDYTWEGIGYSIVGSLIPVLGTIIIFIVLFEEVIQKINLSKSKAPKWL